MRMQLLLVTAACGLTACAATRPDPMATAQPEAVRQARRAEVQPKVEEFINEVAAPETEAGLPRWHQQVCPQVTGISADQGEFVLATISEAGRTAGAPLAGEHCGPNLFVFMTSEPQKLIHEI